MAEIKSIAPEKPVYVVEVKLTQAELNIIVSEISKYWTSAGSVGSILYDELWPFYKQEIK
jgi:hypothetical protein